MLTREIFTLFIQKSVQGVGLVALKKGGIQSNFWAHQGDEHPFAPLQENFHSATTMPGDIHVNSRIHAKENGEGAAV